MYNGFQTCSIALPAQLVFPKAVLYNVEWCLTHSCPPFQHLLSERLTSLGIMGASRVPPLNPAETIECSQRILTLGGR